MKRHLRPFSLLVVDLDSFKQVNDGAGHAVGDALLVEVAHALRRQLRAADYVARIGGDEFVVLLPDANDEAAKVVTQKLLGAISKIRVAAGRETLTTSASIGALTCLPPGDSTWTPEVVLETADSKLYAAKANGRNRASHQSLTIAPATA